MRAVAHLVTHLIAPIAFIAGASLVAGGPALAADDCEAVCISASKSRATYASLRATQVQGNGT